MRRRGGGKCEQGTERIFLSRLENLQMPTKYFFCDLLIPLNLIVSCRVKVDVHCLEGSMVQHRS